MAKNTQEEKERRKQAQEKCQRTKYKNKWIQSEKVYQDNPNLGDLFVILFKARKNQEIAKKEYEVCRDAIGKLLKLSNSTCAINLDTDLQATVSTNNSHSLHKFDEESFKNDHPKLYAQYLIPTRSYTYGGQLRITEITEKARGYYFRFKQGE